MDGQNLRSILKLPYLKPSMKISDVGCVLATITTSDVLEKARACATACGLMNIEYLTADSCS